VTLSRISRGWINSFIAKLGLEEEIVKAYIREQDKEEERYEQLCLW